MTKEEILKRHAEIEKAWDKHDEGRLVLSGDEIKKLNAEDYNLWQAFQSSNKRPRND